MKPPANLDRAAPHGCRKFASTAPSDVAAATGTCATAHPTRAIARFRRHRLRPADRRSARRPSPPDDSAHPATRPADCRVNRAVQRPPPHRPGRRSTTRYGCRGRSRTRWVHGRSAPPPRQGDRVARERREQVLEPVAGRPAIGIAESDDVATRRVDAIEAVVPRFVVAGVRADLDEVDPAPAARAVIPESTARNPRRYSAASRSASRACSSARPPSRTARARTTSRRSPSRSIAASR